MENCKYINLKFAVQNYCQKKHLCKYFYEPGYNADVSKTLIDNIDPFKCNKRKDYWIQIFDILALEGSNIEENV